MSLKRRIGLMCLMSLLAQLARAEFSNEIFEASAPIAEGVPEVALVRLQALLNNNLPEAEWRAVVEKLAEAQIAAKAAKQYSGFVGRYPGPRTTLGKILARAGLRRSPSMG